MLISQKIFALPLTPLIAAVIGIIAGLLAGVILGLTTYRLLQQITKNLLRRLRITVSQKF